jgi:hypothetical protein
MVGHLAGTSEAFDMGARGDPADAKSAINFFRGFNLSPYPPVPPAGAGGGEGGCESEMEVQIVPSAPSAPSVQGMEILEGKVIKPFIPAFPQTTFSCLIPIVTCVISRLFT